MTFPVFWLLVISSSVAIVAALVSYRQLRQQLDERNAQLDSLKSQMLEWNRRLEEKVTAGTSDLEQTSQQLEDTYLQTVTALLGALSAKDPYLYQHSHNVAIYAKAIGQELGFSRERILRLIHGCRLHDIGKIAVPESILMKPGPLTREEFEIIKQHPDWGARILAPLISMQDIREMVHQEHERWDGTGYPQGLRGERIRLEARIISVADALDAMISTRPYRQSTSLQKACDEIRRCSGSHFDPQVAEACLRAVKSGKLVPVAENPEPATSEHHPSH